MDPYLIAEVAPGRVFWDRESKSFHADMSDIQFQGQPVVVVKNPKTGGHREFTDLGWTKDAEGERLFRTYRSKDGLTLKLWND